MDEILKLIKDSFNNLSFDEGEHVYSLGDSKIKISVSGLIKKYKFPTDWKRVLVNAAAKVGKDPNDLSKEWKNSGDVACKIGDKTHIFGELYAFDRTLKPSTGYEEAIVKFWNELPDFIVPLAVEVRMYHKKYLFAGTADILLYNTKTGQIYIADYKTNKDLFKNFKNQKMVSHFRDLLDCPFNHYQIQLSFYQILIEQIFGIKISGRKIVWLKPNGEYWLYSTEDYTEQLLKDLENGKIN